MVQEPKRELAPKRDLTEEKYDALDEKWTKNPPKPGPKRMTKRLDNLCYKM